MAGVTHAASGAGSELRLSGRLDVHEAPAALHEARAALGRDMPARLAVDLSGVEFLDDYGALALFELEQAVRAAGGEFEMVRVPEHVSEMLALVRYHELGDHGPSRARRRPPLLEALGEAGIRWAEDARGVLIFLGDAALALGRIVVRPGRLRWSDTLEYMRMVGVEALPIVGLISFLLGLIMAFMASVQLKQFGANIYVASLVGLSMTRELGPIMTCIIVAGRSGSAFAAEIGSKQINEEVDALSTMGFDITMFLVMPKVVATVLVVPMLTLYSDVFAMLGGLIVGVGMLELTAGAYITQLFKTLSVWDVALGVIKSGAFALLIALVGCHKGLRVRGGADAVGRATTAAVVMGIFLIIVADSVAAVIDRYWG